MPKSEYLFEPNLTEEEVDDLSAGLPDGLDIVVALSPNRRDADKLAMSASLFASLDLVIWFQAIGAAFFAGFLGAAGRSAWESLCDAVGRILDHQTNQGVTRISVENRLIYDDFPALIRMEIWRTDDAKFSEKELRRWYHKATKDAQKALSEAKPLLAAADPETQMVLVDVKDDGIDTQVCDRDLRLARWKSLTRP